MCTTLTACMTDPSSSSCTATYSAATTMPALATSVSLLQVTVVGATTWSNIISHPSLDVPDHPSGRRLHHHGRRQRAHPRPEPRHLHDKALLHITILKLDIIILLLFQC